MGVPILRRKDGTVPAEDEVRRILRQAMRQSGRRREEIAREMTETLGRTVTGSMLADFTRNGSGKRQVRFPAAWVLALSKVTGSDELQRHLLGARLRELLELGDRTVEWAWALRKVRQELAKLDGQAQKRSRKTRRRKAQQYGG
jgi:hypothetical protein